MGHVGVRWGGVSCICGWSCRGGWVGVGHVGVVGVWWVM